jgi:hypothetical protein
MNQKQQNKPDCSTTRVSGFVPYGENSYYVNSPYIKVVDQLMALGHDYMLLLFNQFGQLQIHCVKLLDAYTKGGNVNIKIKNNRDGAIQTIPITMIPGNVMTYPFIIIDLHTLAIELNDPMAGYEHQIDRVKAFQNKTVCWNDVLKIIREELSNLLQKQVLLDFDY